MRAAHRGRAGLGGFSDHQHIHWRPAHHFTGAATDGCHDKTAPPVRAEHQQIIIARVEHGEWVVFFARFIPNIRTLISVPAGLFGMSHKRFILATSAGATVWNSALVYAGYQLQQNVDHIEDYLGPVSLGVIGLIVVAYIWRIIFWRPKED